DRGQAVRGGGDLHLRPSVLIISLQRGVADIDIPPRKGLGGGSSRTGDRTGGGTETGDRIHRHPGLVLKLAGGVVTDDGSTCVARLHSVWFVAVVVVDELGNRHCTVGVIAAVGGYEGIIEQPSPEAQDGVGRKLKTRLPYRRAD